MEIQHVQIDPEIMSGAPCFQGTRVLIKNLFDYLEGQASMEDFLTDFPGVSREAALSVLKAAKHRLLDDATSA